MASLITTMSVPIAPVPSIVLSSSSTRDPAPPASISPPFSLHPSSPSSSSSLSHSNTVRTSHHPFAEPPSFLPRAIRTPKHDSCGLTPPSNARTRAPFRPRSAAKGTSSYQLRQFAEATLGSGSLRKAVQLPEGEDLNEWLAVNGECIPCLETGLLLTLLVVDFYNHINLLYGSITEFCSPTTCPEMKATDE